MKVGLFLTNQQHLGADMVAALDEQVRMVHHARDHGWDSLFSGQHYLNEGNNQQLQLVPFLARLMADAGDMEVGLGVLLLNLHNPVYTAETVASLDVISRGRLIFGVGLGYRDVEFDAFGVPKGQRASRFEAYLELVKRLWAEDEVSFEDATCRLDRVTMNLRPVQKPHPPIWIAANHDRAIRRAARLGLPWFVNPHATETTLKRQMQVYLDEQGSAGATLPAVRPAAKEIFCARTRGEALEVAGPYLAGKYRDYAKWGQDKAMPEEESFDLDFEELLRDRFVLGSPEDCYAALAPYRDALGVNHLIFRTHWAGMPADTALSSMELISKELLPALRAG